ncbi:hypothetical protein [uncultured Shewanella sp.]|uniref:hypothetical protein n=1 Tax=uncultured Shewanella sp. TaxID=173975 RepID=UPI00262EF0E6|nr:hypothetical protein [uncultured Shewanella sp.]
MNTMIRVGLTFLTLMILLLSASWHSAVLAVTKELDLTPYTKTNYLLSKGRYKQVAEHWDKLSILLLANRNGLDQQTMWQSAGLAAALASIAADKNNDPIAYQYWADSTRYLLTGGTNWQQVQAHLHQRLETANTQLSVVLQVNDVTGGLDESLEKELSVLQVWDDKLDFFAFTAPKLGLNKYTEPSQTNQAASNVRQTNRARPTHQEKSNGQQKKLSGFDANFSQTQSFIGAPTVTQTDDVSSKNQLDPEKNLTDDSNKEEHNDDSSIEGKETVINGSDSALSSAAQGHIQPSTAPSPMVRGNLSIIEEQQYESRQKRHSSSPSASELDIKHDAEDKPAAQAEENELPNKPAEDNSAAINGAEKLTRPLAENNWRQTKVNALPKRIKPKGLLAVNNIKVNQRTNNATLNAVWVNQSATRLKVNTLSSKLLSDTLVVEPEKHDGFYQSIGRRNRREACNLSRHY